jgi:hypothetical protein
MTTATRPCPARLPPSRFRVAVNGRGIVGQLQFRLEFVPTQRLEESETSHTHVHRPMAERTLERVRRELQVRFPPRPEAAQPLDRPGDRLIGRGEPPRSQTHSKITVNPSRPPGLCPTATATSRNVVGRGRVLLCDQRVTSFASGGNR